MQDNFCSKTEVILELLFIFLAGKVKLMAKCILPSFPGFLYGDDSEPFVSVWGKHILSDEDNRVFGIPSQINISVFQNKPYIL